MMQLLQQCRRESSAIDYFPLFSSDNSEDTHSDARAHGDGTDRDSGGFTACGGNWKILYEILETKFKIFWSARRIDPVQSRLKGWTFNDDWV